jgi:Glycosidases
MDLKRTWWKEAVVYQIYPKSFYDTNGDGIGDIRGIIEKLGYLKELGVDVLWLCPIYRSPNDDNGYDIADYYAIQPEYGTMADFDELLCKAHGMGLRIIMDLVVNHTSDEHEWFLQSKASKKNDRRDFYIWRPGRDGREPNNWASFFTPSAWSYDPGSEEYYLHLFSKKQPDLNWTNPAVRKAVYAMMAWWLDKGIDGFRMDVINCISKQPDLPDVLPEGGYKWAGQYFMKGPSVHEFLKEMHDKVLSGRDIMTVGETPGVTPDDALRYAGNDGRELNMIFQSELMDIDAGETGKWDAKEWRLTDFKRVVSKWQQALHGKAWNSVFLGNHDQPRIVSRFGDDTAFRAESATLLATLLLTLEGTPYIFQGDEIGMTNTLFNSIEDCRDVEEIQYHHSALETGMDESEILKNICRKGRDNARTPMQWDGTANAGFSGADPWIPVNLNYPDINVCRESDGECGILPYYKRLIRIRHENPALVYGEYRAHCADSEEIMAYSRILGNERFLVILNFSRNKTAFRLPREIVPEHAKILLGNLKSASCKINREQTLLPYEALLIKA